MKRKFELVITFLVLLLVLVSCKVKDKPAPSTDPEKNNAIYAGGVETLLITNMDITESGVNDSLNSVISKIYSLSNVYLQVYSDALPKNCAEIVIGETSRSVSVKAMEILESKITKAAIESDAYPDEESALEDTVGFAIYAEGNSVAVVWSDSHLFEYAMTYFVENYLLSSTLSLEDGYTKVETMSLIEHLDERGQRIREEQWAALEAAIGKEYGSQIVTSMKRLYTLYKPEAVIWLANLYDPVTGGFYYSNSARDNDGYLPDIESTYGALGFVEEMGMAELYDNDFSKALPAWLLSRIGEWVQSLQDEDGYYYHPQWPKEYIYERGLQSRITRDRGSARAILNKLGISESYVLPSAVLGGKLSGSSDKVVAVSKVVATAGVLSQFESVENFRNYINDLDAEVSAIADADSRAGRLYAIGNEFQSTVSLVKKNPEYVKILHEFFKKHQNPTTGTWSSVLTFNATNSLHKIGYVYNSLGLKYDYLYEMIDTVIAILSRDVETNPISSGVDFANAWASIEHIYTNIKISSATSAEAEEKLLEFKNYVYAHITTAIDATFSQLAGFVQQDGSIGYFRGGSSYTSQGCPAAVSGSAEGDVNGYGCASYSIFGYIAIALGLPEYEVKPFGEKERVEFIRTLEKLGEIVKKEEELAEDKAYTFDDGNIPESFGVYVNDTYVPTDGAFVTVEKLDGNNALHVVAVDRKGAAGKMNHSVSVPIVKSHSQANVAVIEFDFFVSDQGSTAHYKMIEWAMRSNGSMVLYPTIGKTSAGKVMLYDSKGVATCELGNVNEKIKFRFEYFWAEGEYKVYINDAFKAKGTTLYASSVTNMPITEMSFYTPTSLYANYYIDNLRAARISKYYDPDETVQYPKTPVTEDFEGEITSEKYGNGYNVTTKNGFSALYSDKYTNNGGATAVVREDENTGNKFLSIYAPARANSEYSHVLRMSIPTEMSGEPNAYVFEAKLKLNSICTSRNFLQIVFLNTTSSYRYGQLNMTVNGDGMICLAGLPIGYFDEWFDLRLEYHFDVGVIRAYNNDRFMGEITEFSASDSITDKKVPALTSLTDFSVGTMNSGGSISFNVDNMAISTRHLEYEAKEKESLPAPNPDPDDFLPVVTDPTPDPDVGGGTDEEEPGDAPDDFEIGTPTIVETFENGYKDNILTFSDGSTVNAPSFGDYTYTSIPYTGSYSNTTKESVARVVEYVFADGGKNKVLNMFSPGRINSDGTTNSNNRSHSAEFMIMESVVPEDKVNAAAIEFDFKLGFTIPEGSCATKLATDPTQLVFRNYPNDPNNNGNHGWHYFQLNPKLNVETKTLTIVGVDIPNVDEFVRIKLVIDYNDKLIHVYANGELLGSGAPDQGSDAWNVFKTYGINVASISCYNASGMSDVYLDNVSFYNTYCLD